MDWIKYSGVFHGKTKRPGAEYAYALWVPENAPGELGVFLSHDGLNEAQAEAMGALAQTGEAPFCAVFGVWPGVLPSALPEGYPRNLRFNDYDVFDSGYMDFAVDELIPALAAEYGLRLSPDPDLHMVTGGSSGGISAWNGVWFRNDYFRRAYLSSPTFSAMARGNLAPVWMRIFETKPIRVFTEYSEHEPDDYFGSSFCAGLEAQKALEFAGYDFDWAYYPGEGHCSRYNDRETAEKVFRRLWRGWKTEPVTAPRNSPRVDAVIVPFAGWEETTYFPAERTDRYFVRDGAVFLQTPAGERQAATGVSAAALSSDRCRLYLADAAKGVIEAADIAADGSLSGRRRFASLHAYTDFTFPGARDICVDSRDRLFAATELGVQSVRSFGLVDAVLPLPQNRVPLRVALEGKKLYVDCGDAIFVRPVKAGPAGETVSRPRFEGYYETAEEAEI